VRKGTGVAWKHRWEGRGGATGENQDLMLILDLYSRAMPGVEKEAVKTKHWEPCFSRTNVLWAYDIWV